MDQVPVAVILILAAAVVAALVALAAWRHTLKAHRRGLASALVGELAGILRTIETDDLENRLRQPDGEPGRRRRLSKSPPLLLPEPVVFQANAARLDLFEPSLAREIANLYALFKGVNASLAAVAGDARLTQAALSELQEGLSLADDVLHRLRPLL